MDYPIDGKYQVEQKIVSEPDGNVYLGEPSNASNALLAIIHLYVRQYYTR